jgi:hypothetical protein
MAWRVVLGDAAPLRSYMTPRLHCADASPRSASGLEQPQRGSKITVQVGSDTGFLIIERDGHCSRFRLERSARAPSASTSFGSVAVVVDHAPEPDVTVSRADAVPA